jgi:hypothetical protein
VISEDQFPDLSEDAEERMTGFIMALTMTGQIQPPSDAVLWVMVLTLGRLVDGAFLDYQSARQAYYRYYQDKGLGGTLPISAALVPFYHHIENCLSNMERVREMVNAIRIRKPLPGMSSLVDKTDWRRAEAHEPAITGLRNAIQHRHQDLLNGIPPQGTVEYRDTGHVALGGHVLALADLAKTLLSFKQIANRAVEALRTAT